MDMTSMWPYALAAVLILALVIMVLLVVLLRRASKSSEFPDPNEPPPEEAMEPEAKTEVEDDDDAKATVGIGTAFRHASRLLRRTTATDRHEVPFFLLLGAAGSRDADLLGTTGLELPFGNPSDEKMSLGKGRGFWFFDRGLMLDIVGDAVLRADGQSAHDGQWTSLVGELKQLRPRRPIDGIVLTISCADLVDAASDELRRADFAVRIGRVYRRLSDAQRQLGFRLPTYVLITGAQQLTGFTSLCASLSADSRQEILGWSNPYAVDSVYRGTWVEEAFTTLSSRLDDLQMEIFTEGTTRGDELLQLPSAIRTLAAPLRAACDQIFKASAYHGALMFRGIYLCGREEITGRTAFSGELLERKVFAEATLATPTARVLAYRHRNVRLAQGFAVGLAILFTIGLAVAKWKFDKQNEELKDFINKSVNAMEWVDSQPAGKMADAELQRQADAVLNGMAGIDFHHFGSVAVPSSWLNPMEGQVRNAIQVAFREVIFEAIEKRLEQRARDITNETHLSRMPSFAVTEANVLVMPADNVSAAVPKLARIEEMPDFITLQKMLRDLRILEQHGDTFNKVIKADQGELRQLGSLVEYSFGKPLPQSFFTNGALYEEALQGVSYNVEFKPEQFKPLASANARELSDSLLRNLYDNNALGIQLTRLAASLRSLASTTSWYGSGTTPFADISRQIRDIETGLAGPQLEWAFSRQFTLGQPFEDALSDMQRSPFIGAEVAGHVRAQAVSGWNDFQKSRLTVETPITKTILAQDSDGRPAMHLSPDTLLLKSALDTFLGQGFVSSPNPPRKLEWQPQSGFRLVWDTSLLDRAASVSQAYDRFRDSSLNRFKYELRASIDQVARERAKGEMLDLLAQAATYDNVAPAVSAAMLEDELRADVARFVSSSAPVGNVMDAFERLGAVEERSEVANVETAEAYRLLLRVDRLLASDAPYRAKQGNFSWWEGGAPPSPAAWGAADPNEVGVYLETTRTRVALLSRNYAQPLIGWLAKARTKERPDVRELSSKWQGIIDDLRDYEAKKPGNAIASIEDYITTQMPKVTVANCSAAAPVSMPRSQHGFYWLSLSDLSGQLSSRCYAVAGKDAGTRYTDLARYFNQRLAGRYPFSETAARSGDPEADPDDVRNFFKLFDSSQAVIRSVPSDGGLGTEFASARQFVDEMVAVRGFLAPFVDAPKVDVLPSWDVEPTFRVLTERESDGNQIIGWTFAVGDEVLSNREKTKKLRWSTGKPVRISMRWANDSPTVPASAGTSSGVVRGRTVTYEYNDRWALLTALASHRAALQALPKFVDTDPVTLGFTITTQSAKGGPVSDKPAQVYMRLALLAPGTTQPLDLPRFPSRAPRLEKTSVTAEASK